MHILLYRMDFYWIMLIMTDVIDLLSNSGVTMVLFTWVRILTLMKFLIKAEMPSTSLYFQHVLTFYGDFMLFFCITYNRVREKHRSNAATHYIKIYYIIILQIKLLGVERLTLMVRRLLLMAAERKQNMASGILEWKLFIDL